jgi:V8-like Glu-specific endopeptidase
MPTYATSDTTSSIFKIQAYSYNTVSQMYELEQYGSAVLVAPNILLTNAHVVTDADDKFTLQYEACQTISSSEAPSCFSTLQLLSYDKSADLALLKIVSPTENMPNPVTL